MAKLLETPEDHVKWMLGDLIIVNTSLRIALEQASGELERLSVVAQANPGGNKDTTDTDD